jgi:ABC-type transporter Mla subunit MlaD
MARLLAILALVGTAAVAVLVTGSSGEPSGTRYYAEFDNAFGLVEGGDLKVGGVRAGQTRNVEVTFKGERPIARVELDVTEPGFDSFRADATCAVRQQSMIGEYFVDCQQGSSSRELAGGGTLPVRQTRSTIPLDAVNNILRLPYRQRFRLILSELGSGLAGRPEDIQEVLRRAHPGLRETSRMLRVLGDENRELESFLRDSDVVIAALARRKRDVARWVTETGRTGELTAERRDALAAQLRRLPTFLDELEPTMARLGELTDEQTPLLHDLRAAAPDTTELFDELGPFAKTARPSVRSLGRMSVTGSRALERSREEVAALKRAAGDTPGLGKSLRQFLETLDTRERSVSPDPRAAETAPPAPDKTADARGKGFTGFEAIWNYFYWQTLAVNGFDEISHILRTIGFESPCAAYSTDPDPELQEKCASYTGPYQPGLQKREGGGRFTDPTDTNNDGIPDRFAGRFEPAGGGGERAERRTGRSRRSARGRRGGRRDGGSEGRSGGEGGRSPELPPALQNFLDSLTGGGAGPSAPAPPSPSGPASPPDVTGDLLDFLLAP